MNSTCEISACTPPVIVLPLSLEDMKTQKKTVLILRVGADVRDELKREAVAKGKTVSSIARERLAKKRDTFRAWKPKG